MVRCQPCRSPTRRKGMLGWAALRVSPSATPAGGLLTARAASPAARLQKETPIGYRLLRYGLYETAADSGRTRQTRDPIAPHGKIERRSQLIWMFGGANPRP